MMTDGVGRRSATLSVQGQVRKSNGRRRRHVINAGFVGAKPLNSTRKSAEAEFTGFRNPATRRDRPAVPSRRSRASVDEGGSYVSRSLALRRQRSEVRNPLGRAIIFNGLGKFGAGTRTPSYRIATSDRDSAATPGVSPSVADQEHIALIDARSIGSPMPVQPGVAGQSLTQAF